jgi:hypothetical protein
MIERLSNTEQGCRIEDPFAYRAFIVAVSHHQGIGHNPA